MPSRRTMAGKAGALAGVLGERNEGWRVVWGVGHEGVSFNE